MAGYKVEYTASAVKQLCKLDIQTRKLIYAWIDKNLQGCENPHLHGKGLRSDRSGQWRYRIGNYRIIAEIEDSKVVILIINIANRSEVYKLKP